MYRLNTYPVIHANFLHAFLNAVALTPLLERFEAEHGTLTALLLFVGRMLYTLDIIDAFSMLTLGISSVHVPRRDVCAHRKIHPIGQHCRCRRKVDNLQFGTNYENTC